jgi:hypothetical protein
MQQQFGGVAASPARTPIGEIGRAVGGLPGSYLASHPQSADRSHRLNALMSAYRSRPAGQQWYTGAERYGDELQTLQKQ